jgi:hypothetical protein
MAATFFKPNRVVLLLSLVVALTALLLWALIDDINQTQQIVLISALSVATLSIIVLLIKTVAQIGPLYNEGRGLGGPTRKILGYDRNTALLLLIAIIASTTAIVNLVIPEKLSIRQWLKWTAVAVVAAIIVMTTSNLVAKTSVQQTKDGERQPLLRQGSETAQGSIFGAYYDLPSSGSSLTGSAQGIGIARRGSSDRSLNAADLVQASSGSSLTGSAQGNGNRVGSSFESRAAVFDEDHPY